MPKRIFAWDRVSVSSRTITPEGYLVAPGTLSRAGVFMYLARELDLSDRKPNDVVKVHRSAETMQQAASSFEGVPITNDHPRGNRVTASTWRKHAIGDAHSVAMNGTDMNATLVIRDKNAVEQVVKGRRFLSNGYSYDLVPKTGRTADGADYEFEQQNVLGNHVAIVDAARCGPSCAIGDRAQIPNQKERSSHMARAIAIDGYSFDVEDEMLATAVQKLQQQNATLASETAAFKAAVPKVRVGDKDYSAQEVEGLLSEKDKRISDLEHERVTPERLQASVIERSGVVTAIGDMAIDGYKPVDTATTEALRREALTKLFAVDATAKTLADPCLGGLALDAAPDVAVKVAFDVVAAHKKAQPRVAVDQQAIAHALGGPSFSGSTADPRSPWIRHLENAWKGDQ